MRPIRWMIPKGQSFPRRGHLWPSFSYFSCFVSPFSFSFIVSFYTLHLAWKTIGWKPYSYRAVWAHRSSALIDSEIITTFSSGAELNSVREKIKKRIAFTGFSLVHFQIIFQDYKEQQTARLLNIYTGWHKVVWDSYPKTRLTPKNHPNHPNCIECKFTVVDNYTQLKQCVYKDWMKCITRLFIYTHIKGGCDGETHSPTFS